MEKPNEVKIDISELITAMDGDPNRAWNRLAKLWSDRFGVSEPSIPNMEFFEKCIKLNGEKSYKEIFLFQIRTNSIMYSFTCDRGNNDWNYELFYFRNSQNGYQKEEYPLVNIEDLKDYEANLGAVAQQFELPRDRSYFIDAIHFDPLTDCGC